MKPLLILQTGSTYPALQRHYGDFPDWIRQGLGDQAPVTVVMHTVIPCVEAVEGCPLTVVMRQELQRLQLGQGPAAVTVQQQQL